MSGIEDWEPVPASNNAAPPVGAPENQDRSDVNNIAREMMASMRADWEGSADGGGEWRNLIKGETLSFVNGTTVDVLAVDVTAFFPAGRKIRVVHPASSAYCYVASSTFGVNTRIVVGSFDAAGDSAISSNLTGLQIHCAFGGGFGIKSGAFETAGSSLFEIPAALTAAGIQAAINAAKSGGKHVLLDDATYLLETAVTLGAGVQIWGRGMHGSTVLKVDYDGYGLQLPTHVDDIVLRDFTIDGFYTDAGRTQGGCIHALLLPNDRITLERVRCINAYHDCLHMLGSNAASQRELIVRDCEFETFGRYGIHLEDANSLSSRNLLTGLSFRDVGISGAHSASPIALYVEGQAALSDIDVTLDGFVGLTSTGIRLEQVGVAGATEGARKLTLNGFRVMATVAGAGAETGLFVGGTECMISNGHVECVGASGKPVVVDGRGGSPEQALDNHISGVRFVDGLRCEVASDALRTEFHNCVFDGQSAIGLRIYGHDTLLKNCTILGGQPTGVVVGASALDVEFCGCTVRDASIGVNVQSGSNDAVITGCTFRDTTSDAVRIDAGAARARVNNNVFDGIIGNDVGGTGSGMVVSGNEPLGVDADVSFTTSAAQNNFGLSQVEITDLQALTFPHGGANGSRRYLIEVQVCHDIDNAGGDDVTVYCHIGTAGTKADSVVESYTTSIGYAVTIQNKLGLFVATPLSGEVFTVSINASFRSDNDVEAHGAGVTLFMDFGLAQTFVKITYLDG